MPHVALIPLPSGYFEAHQLDALEQGGIVDEILWTIAAHNQARLRFSFNLLYYARNQMALTKYSPRLFSNLPVFQFWDTVVIPSDVRAAMDSISQSLDGVGYELFDDSSAGKFNSFELW